MLYTTWFTVMTLYDRILHFTLTAVIRKVLEVLTKDMNL